MDEESAIPNEGGAESLRSEVHEAMPGMPSPVQGEVSEEQESASGNDHEDGAQDHAGVPEQPEVPVRETGVPEHDPGFWKQEVTARVDSFRARRKPRPPRYPSLSFTFEPMEVRQEARQSAPLPKTEPVVMQTNAPDYENHPESLNDPFVAQAAGTDSARIIEFPRSFDEPASPDYELAEPVRDRPRIVEAPDVAPPPPALGGITIEPEEQEPEQRPGFEIPLQVARLGLRFLAGAFDGLIVLAATVLFAYTFFRITGAILPPTQVLSLSIAFSILFWAGYQYLFLTFTGSTPGLRVAALELRRFDGKRVPRSLRRWRVLTSILSALSLGLGYAWCLLDEDTLCWHDRITHTYLAPR